MKIDIPYYIRQVLREQRMVHVPGIGTFNLDQVPSQFNDDKSLIHPPILNLSFNDEDSDNDSLFKYILDTGKYAEDKIREKIDKYTQTAFNTLLNVDAFEIDGIGSIIKEGSEEKVTFKPNLSKLTREYKGLKAIALSPIQRINENAA